MRFGILGEAKIAREWLVPAIIEAGHEVTHLGEEILAKNLCQRFIKMLLRQTMKDCWQNHLSMQFTILYQTTFMCPTPSLHSSQANMCFVKNLSH